MSTERALELLGHLRARGIEAEAKDLGETRDVFPIYHKAVPGRARPGAVLGTKGALEEDFGCRVPALMVFESDRYPAEVFPRMDRELNRIVGVEEALERLAASASS